jgi:hypothetical protein
MTDEDLAEARAAQRAGEHATAVAIYRRWAEHGDVRAQDELGMVYEKRQRRRQELRRGGEVVPARGRERLRRRHRTISG